MKLTALFLGMMIIAGTAWGGDDLQEKLDEINKNWNNQKITTPDECTPDGKHENCYTPGGTWIGPLECLHGYHQSKKDKYLCEKDIDPVQQKLDKIIKMLEGMQPKTQADRMLPDFQQEKILDCQESIDSKPSYGLFILWPDQEKCIAKRRK